MEPANGCFELGLFVVDRDRDVDGGGPASLGAGTDDQNLGAALCGHQHGAHRRAGGSITPPSMLGNPSERRALKVVSMPNQRFVIEWSTPPTAATVFLVDRPAELDRSTPGGSGGSLCPPDPPPGKPETRRPLGWRRWRHASPDAQMTLVPPRVVPLRYSRISWRGRTLVIGTAALILLLTAGCGSSSSDRSGGARAAGRHGHRRQSLAAAVLADLKAEAAAGKKGKAKTEPSSPLASPKAANGTYTPAATAAALTNRILYELYGQELVAHHAKVAADDKDRARQSLCSDATTGQPPTGTACPPLAAYSATYRNFQLALRERRARVRQGSLRPGLRHGQAHPTEIAPRDLPQPRAGGRRIHVQAGRVVDEGRRVDGGCLEEGRRRGQGIHRPTGMSVRRCGASEPGQGDEGRGRAGHERVRHGCRGGDIVQDGHQGRVRDAATRG